MSRRLTLCWLAFLAAVPLALQPVAHATGEGSTACSLPSGTPPVFRSTCSLIAAQDVAPGGTLRIFSERPILDVETNGA